MNYFEITQTFIENAARQPDLRSLANLFYNTISKLGCTHFICMSHVSPLNPPEDAIVLTNYPLEWGYYHHEKNYHTFDPIFNTCSSQVTPFTWTSERWRYLLTPQQVNMLGEASEFGLVDGYTVPIHPPTGYPASCSVVFRPGEIDPQILHAINTISLYLYEAAIGMRTNVVSIHRSLLTDEQRITLEHIAMGKSDWAISRILGVSQDAIKGRVKRIFEKLNVRTRQQALMRALFLGEIRYADIFVSQNSTNGAREGFVHLQP